MPRIKVRFILESSKQKQVPWRKTCRLGLALAWDGRQAKEQNFQAILCRFAAVGSTSPACALCKLCGLRRQTRIARIGR